MRLVMWGQVPAGGMVEGSESAMLGEWPDLPPQVIQQLGLMFEAAHQCRVVVVDRRDA